MLGRIFWNALVSNWEFANAVLPIFVLVVLAEILYRTTAKNSPPY